jgi:hypothetical protein
MFTSTPAGKAPVIFPAEQRRLAALGLDKDVDALAADDHVGRRLQDLALMPQPKS